MKFVVNSKVLIYTTFLGIIVFLIGAVLGYKVFPYIVENKVWERTVLKENTTQWNMFIKIPFPFLFKVYIFTITNPEGILLGEKPVLKEIGPYIYRLHRWKSDVTTSEDVISFHDYLKFEFDQRASAPLSENDVVVTLNSLYNGFLLSVEEVSPNFLATVSTITQHIFGENDGLFMKVKVRDYLFDGLPLCVNGGEAGGFAAKLACNKFRDKVNESVSLRISDDIIYSSYFFHKNMTRQGKFTINSGVKACGKYANLIQFNDQQYLSAWNGEHSVCNKVRGVISFPPFISKSMTFDVLGEDVCRFMTIEYRKSLYFKSIEGYLFMARNDTFSEPVENSDNYCFCTNQSRTLDGGHGCLRDGLGDLKTCTGAPALLSFPHLLYADKSYINSIEGVQPNESLHGTYVLLEPTTGLPLKVAKRVQFNMFIRPIPDVDAIANITHALVPLFWVEEYMELPDQYITLLTTGLFRRLQYLAIFKWLMMFLGASTAVLSVGLLIYTNK